MSGKTVGTQKTTAPISSLHARGTYFGYVMSLIIFKQLIDCSLFFSTSVTSKGCKQTFEKKPLPLPRGAELGASKPQSWLRLCHGDGGGACAAGRGI